MLRLQKSPQLIVCATLLGLPAAIGFALPAQALSLYTGYDENPADGTVLPLASRVNSTAAFNQYLGNLTGVTTESFETTAVGTPINDLAPILSGVTSDFVYTTDAAGTTSVGSGATASVQKANATSGLTNSGTFPTDGKQGISINSTNFFKIKFGNPLAAFSFWGTDLGDNKNALTVILRNAGVQVGSQSINYLGTNAGDSSVFFFGAIAQNAAEQFDEVQLLSSITGSDAIGIDQLTVGTAAQLTPQSSNAVPTPALLPGLIALAAGARRRSKAAQ
jgi:hypothetical protein